MSVATITTGKVSVPPPGQTSRLRSDLVDGLRALAASIVAACYAFHRVAERPFLAKPPSGLEASIR